MAGELDDLRHTATIDTGDGSVPLFDADGRCAAWRYLMVEATQPVELALSWTGRLPWSQAVKMTGRTLQVCLHASQLSAAVTNLGGAPARVAAGVMLSAERVTNNVLDVPLAAQGVVVVPSFATHARLDTRPLDNPGDARLELLDGAGAVIGVVSPGHAIPLGRASSVRSVCPSPHRLLFSLSI